MQPLIDKPGACGFPRLSPHGRRLALAVNGEDGRKIRAIGCVILATGSACWRMRRLRLPPARRVREWRGSWRWLGLPWLWLPASAGGARRIPRRSRAWR